MPPVMDLEWDKSSTSSRDRWSSHTPAEIVDAALKFLTRIEELTGRTPMIYTSRAWWRERGIAEEEIARFSRYKLWIADYSNATLDNEDPRAPNNIVPDIWQFTDRAKITDGTTTSSFDGNIYKGSLDQFLLEFTGK